MNRLVPLKLAIFVCAWFGTSNGQSPQREEHVEIGGVRLVLGMQRDEVLRAFKNGGLHPRVPDGGSVSPGVETWVICEDLDSLKTSCSTEGSVEFKEGRLIVASVNWAPQADSAVDTADALLDAVQDTEKQGMSQCHISISQSAKPGYEYRQFTLSCGLHYEVHVLVLKKGAEPTEVEIQQTLIQYSSPASEK